MNFRYFILVALVIVHVVQCKYIGRSRENKKPLKAIGRFREEPPQFMVELYQRATSHELDAKAVNPYNASIVRSIKGIDIANGLTRFNLDILKEESCLGAELHVYGAENDIMPELVSIKAMTKVGKVTIHNDDGLYGPGWTVIDVHDFVDKKTKEFVMETAKFKPDTKVYLVVYSEGIQKVEESATKRSKRQATILNGGCGKVDMEVDFEKIGWTSWIISPKGYNAHRCTGACKFPIGEEYKPTNHATIQSIVSQLPELKTIPAPCCTPAKLLPLTMLFYDENDNVVLKQYDDMIVDHCGCQ